MSETPLLRLENATKSFSRKNDAPLEILHPTTLTIEAGERVAIVGPSGSGKSTLLSLLGMLSMPTTGSLEVCGRSVGAMGERKRSALRADTIGFVFQQFHLIDTVSALENVMMALQLTAVPRHERREMAIEALRRVGLGDRIHHRPSQLSGGEQQRVAIARALAKRPAIVFADEPTGALDSETGRSIVDLLLDIGRSGTALVVVTHDRSVAARFDRCLTIQDGHITTDTSNPVISGETAAAPTSVRLSEDAAIPIPVMLSEGTAEVETSRRPLTTRIIDLIHNAWQGVTGRMSRTILAALGIALGVAAYVALSGVAASNQAALLAQLDALGANLSVVRPAENAGGRKVEIPAFAPDTLRRQPGIEQVGVFHAVPVASGVFKNEFISRANGNGIAVSAMEPGALNAVGATIATGRGINATNRSLPVALLGSEAAYRLGVTEPGDRILIDNTWYGVIGILNPVPQATAFNTTALIGDEWAFAQYDSTGSQEPGGENTADSSLSVRSISEIYVRTSPGLTGDAGMDATRRLIAHAANPGGELLSVSASNDLSSARAATDATLTTLGALIGAIALLIGGMSIATMMLVTVMERRCEIGLRRALGATPGTIRAQFVAEALLLSILGAGVGSLTGAVAAAAIAVAQHQPLVLDWTSLPLACAAAILVGILAGLYPASRAAALAPTEALRSE